MSVNRATVYRNDAIGADLLHLQAVAAQEDKLQSTISVASDGASSSPAAVVPLEARAKPDYPELALIPQEHYVIAEELAHGGMGRVFRARDRRLGREVAIKALVKNSPRLAARLEREARITAQLHHPAIVKVHEAGMWPGAEPFYAMELVAGRRLGDAIAATSTLDERLALLPHAIAVTDALAYAHAQRIIHRDLKPSNILIGEFGETVVIDWGLAKDLRNDTADDADPIADEKPRTKVDATVAGSVLGTPAYMPPEQAAGRAVDERADVYALGAMLYHVLAGTPPYTGNTSDDILAAVKQGPPRPIAEVAQGAPSDLVTIVGKAMQHDAAKRYPSARELADDLRKFQTGQLVGAHRYTTWQLVQRWLRRHRAAVSIGATLLVVLAVVSVISVQRIVQAREVAESKKRDAETQRAVAEQEAARARAAERQVQTQLDQIKTEQMARSRAETEARTRGAEVVMTKEQLQAALAKAEAERATAEKARAMAEQESKRARDAELRAEKAAGDEKQLRQETEQLYQAERARAKALEAAPAKGITTKLSK